VATRPVPFVRQATGLVREWGLLTTLSLTWGALGSVQVFPISAIAKYPGANFPLAYALVGLLMVPLMLLFTYLSIDMPRSASPYVFASRAANPFLGYISSFCFVISSCIILGVSYYVASGLLARIVEVAGRLANSPGLMQLGAQLGSPAGTVALAIVLLTLSLASLFNRRAFAFFINWPLFLFPLVMTSIAIAVLLLVPREAVPSLYDATLGGGAYREILDVAKKAGWDAAKYGAYSLTATASVIPLVLYALVGFERPTFLAGEIRRPAANMLRGLLYGSFALAVFYILLAVAPFAGYGVEWVSAYSTAITKPAQLALNPRQGITAMQYLAAALLPGLGWLQILLLLSAPLWFIHVGITRLAITSRAIFALSFEHFFPEALSRVSARTSTPLYSDLAVYIGGLVGIFLNAYAGYLLGAIAGTLLYVFIYLVASLGAILYPITCKEIYGQGLRWEIRGVPVISILGIIAFPISLFLLFMSAVGAGVQALTFTGVLVGIGSALFVYYWFKNQRAGIDLELMFKAIPPE
jgi:APA family basic amino acid/polyamine antiporter